MSLANIKKLTMNKLTTILLAIIMLFCSETSLGQTNKFDIGLENGPSLRSLWGDDLVENSTDPTIGFSTGQTFQYNFPKLISIRTNVTYERKGAFSKLQLTDVAGNPIKEITFYINLDYLTMPLLIRLTFGNKIKFFVNIGPYFSYLINQTFDTSAFNLFPIFISDNTDSFKRFDMGLSSGLGGGLPINDNFLLTLEIRNNLGFYNVSNVPIDNNGSILTNSTNLLIGIAYRFGTRNE